MLIFRFEWKRTRNYILIWAAALAVCIFSMTPVYYDMIETAGTLPSGFTQGGFWETLDVRLLGMCDRNFLSTGFIFDDDAVSPWISCGRIPVGGRLLCPPYAFFRTAGIDGRNIPSQ